MNKLNSFSKDSNIMMNILGEYDKNLKALRYFYMEDIVCTNDSINTTAEEPLLSEIDRLFSLLIKLSLNKIALRERDVTYIASAIKEFDEDEIFSFYLNREEIVKNINGKSIYPKTLSQVEYLKELNKNELILSFGPAGVGKTYLAVCDAVKRYKSGQFQKIILSRPIVEAGESLGYLPGEIKEKVDPYLIPLYDALYELMGKRTVDGLIEEGIIEIAPLAYMRGRTLENAYIILDEAQNATKKQIKLFLTRLGFNAKMVLTGDLSQIDLINHKDSGLLYACNKLNNIPGIKIIEFKKNDVVRNPLVQRIIERLSDD